MAEIYSYMKPAARILFWATQRRDEIKKQLAHLQLEDEIMTDIEVRYSKLCCQACRGQGTIMRAIEGCECDGPRLHKCDMCGGTGEPK